MKRLSPLPKEVREAYKPYDRGHTSHFRKPENSISAHNIHRGVDKTARHERVANLDLEAIEIYRGRAARYSNNGTTVTVIAVLDSKVITTTSDTIFWKGDPAYDTSLRPALIEAKEHELAEKLRASIAEYKVSATEKLAKAAYDALASTRLATVRERIADAEASLAKLREEETELAAEAAKENVA